MFRSGLNAGLAAMVALALFVGCDKGTARINAPPQGASDRTSPVADYFAYSTDQAMLADNSIADIHFIPHTARLSGAGHARLSRYAELLAETGGAINYDTAESDAKLVNDRLKTARDFLAHASTGSTHIDVVVGLAGSRGMESTEAITRHKGMLKQGASEKKSGSSSSAGGMQSLGGSSGGN